MGLFDLFKGGEETSSKESKAVKWIPFETEDQLETLVSMSKVRPQIIFKNSISCGISGIVLRSFQSNYTLDPEQADLYLLHIQDNRKLSSMISEQFGIRHESPQLLIIRNGDVVCQASHGGITNISVEDHV